MSGTVLGLGFGTIIFVVLFSVSLVLCCVSLRTQSKIGPIFVVGSSVVMLILFSIPRDSDSSLPSQKVEDPLFIPRLCLSFLLAVSAISGFCFIVSDTLMSQVRPKLIRQ